MINPLQIQQTFDWLKLIEILKWPLVLIVIVLILRRPIINLINRITKVGYGNKSIEANQQNILKQSDKKEISEVDRAIGLFRKETIETFNTAVEKETKIKELNSDSERVNRLKNYSCIIYIMRHFDHIYNSIFGSQIRILERLNTLRPETRESLKFFYDLAKESNPSFYEKYAYKDYLNFLFGFNLIREDEGRINITVLGSDFLKYLAESNKEVNKPN